MNLIAIVAAAALPLAGTVTDDVRYRVVQARPATNDDVRSSWCLRLRYTGGIVLDADPFTRGIKGCGERPAPRVSGIVTYDCELRVAFAFGAVRAPATGVRGAQAAGRRYVLARRFRDWPRVLRETDGRRVVRLPSPGATCKPLPGAPEGGQPFFDFP